MSQFKSLVPVATNACRARQKTFKVSIEGNIGSGKSTCIKYFEKYNNVETHSEPLHEWRNVSGHNLLGLMYSDIHKWTFPFQHYVHLSRLKIQTSPPANPNISVKMFERSVQNSRYCFIENAKKHNFLEDTEYQVLLSWYDYTEKNLDISLDLIAKAHQLLVEAYNKDALSERACCEWLQKFKNGNFDIEDKDRSGRPKIYENAELEEDSSQTQKQLALTLEVTQQAVSHRLKLSSI
ncbi:Deoxynucleoside kinase [Eumeta japonica]|uniref:Deoxynucleoside kinase n=1 Tax=Eumeta variegata TaxID=151549 RepID=A0A4C1XHP8_EUMVA|nr:Deoxynucleoside kinase [Eumeta japonica]